MCMGTKARTRPGGWARDAKLNRHTSLEDVADHVVTFCCAESVTGQVLVIDGGIVFIKVERHQEQILSIKKSIEFIFTTAYLKIL